MRIRITLLLFQLIAVKIFSQEQLFSIALTAKLQSVSMSAGKESHFGELYLQTTIAGDVYIQSLPANGQQLMKRMEQNFAGYFFRAIEARYNETMIPAEWQNYFNGKELTALQLKLLGANAHINGDIWQAMRSSFSLAELKEIKPFYKNYNDPVTKVFDNLFENGIESDKRLRNLHLITFGLDKVCGRMMLHKWRNRQWKLAILSFENPGRFKRLKKRIDKKRNKIDQLIINRLRTAE